MPLTLYYSKINPAAFAATEEAAGYPAANVGREEIGRPWQSTTTGANDLTLTWPAATDIAGVLLEDVNFAACNVATSADGVTFGAPAAMTCYMDKQTGRYRGLLALGALAKKGVRFSIGAGATTDGRAFKNVGAAYAFALSSQLPRGFDYGHRIKARRPRVSRELANWKTAWASTGPDFLVATLHFKRKPTQDVLELLRRASSGTVGVDFGLSDYPEEIMPATIIAGEHEESFPEYVRSESDIELVEQV